jgi:proline iminopeptidase
VNDYLDNGGPPDRLSGGVRMIPVNTPKGRFRVRTKRIGNSPRIKLLLLLHG